MSESKFPTGDRQLHEVLAEYLRAEETGVSASDEFEQDLIAKHPELADQLRKFFADKRKIDDLAGAGTDHEKTPPDGLAPTLPPTPKNDSESTDDCATTSSLVGDALHYFGDYELLEEIARGGMGVVYKARQVSLNRIVAVKMILAGQLASEQDVKRFRAEAEAAANLEHPGIVPIFEVGEHNGQHFFSMGYVEGENLADQIKRGPLPPKLAAEYVKKTAHAVAYAHSKGVIHRDLKPGNVLLGEDKQNTRSSENMEPGGVIPKVTDFGLAKRIESESDLTATGQILGTPSYMAPEQATGDADGKRITESVDIYSLGAVLYGLITGRPPFQAESPLDTLLRVIEQEPTPPRDLNRQVDLDLQTIALKCLEKSPERRYESANELANDLQRYLDGRPILARPIGRSQRAWRRRIWRRCDLRPFGVRH